MSLYNKLKDKEPLKRVYKRRPYTHQELMSALLRVDYIIDLPLQHCTTIHSLHNPNKPFNLERLYELFD